MNAPKVGSFIRAHEEACGIALGVLLCALACTLIWHEGVKRGRETQRLADLQIQKAVVQKLIAKHSGEVAAAKKVAAAAVAAADSAAHARDVARKKIELHGDTATTASGTQVLLPEISSFIRSSDVAAPKESGARAAQADVIQKQDTLVGDHVKRELIDDEQNRILERQAHPRCGFRCGALVGAGAMLLVVKAAALIL